MTAPASASGRRRRCLHLFRRPMRDYVTRQAQDVALLILLACAGKPTPRRGQVAGIVVAIAFALAAALVTLL